MTEGTWVGLDVHARKVVAGVLDAATGELKTVRVPAAPAETTEWLARLPAPVRVAYEAGPTGYGLARACAVAGIGCTVAAPSKIPRAAGDKVKTDRRDAERLARLLRLGELVAVRVPEPHEEQARDLVRAREDARGELMRARHRLSKLLLRHGRVPPHISHMHRRQFVLGNCEPQRESRVLSREQIGKLLRKVVSEKMEQA
jgi:transposase